MIKNVLLILVFIISFTSCDYFVLKEGRVIDYKTGIPIENVKITIQHKIKYTDKLGCYKFNLNSPSELTMVVEKDGYKPFIMKFKEGSELIYKVENKMDKTEYPNGYKVVVPHNSTYFERIYPDSIIIKLERK